MREVRFAQYRRYETRRVEASNAMMALLAGAGMAFHLLQVPHIGRFNLRSELAREILDTADVHLGPMAIRYALTIHDNFMRECIDLLVTAGACTGGQARRTNSLHARHPP